MDELLLGFYADDFTGATDALNSLNEYGVETVLFLEDPDREQLRNRFCDVQAIGIAGTARSMPVDELEAHLPGRFDTLADLDPTVVHYKVCSTFDSSPEIGNIGRAIELAADHFATPYVPAVVGAPPLGRYVVFGNLFAQDDDGDIYRIDRHPTMRDHPVTPMTEGDLGRHLAEQAPLDVGLVSVLDVPDLSVDDVPVENDVVFFDTLELDHLRQVGDVLWSTATDLTDPLFVVGSSGFGYGLGSYWQSEGIVEASTQASVDIEEAIVVVSGSASPLTDRQIGDAVERGFADIRLDTPAIIDPETRADECDRVVEAVRTHLTDSRSVVLYTARGPDDPAIEATKDRASDLGIESDAIGQAVAKVQGKILREILDATDVDRVCVAGGDTSGHVTSQLDVFALEHRAALAPGAPLCRAHAHDEAFDGLELALKGGQLGDEAYFDRVRRGDPLE